MRIPENGEERPIAWTAILPGTPVYTADGTEVGMVYEVIGAEDIFHGILVRGGISPSDVLISAVEVRTITGRRIEVTLNAEEVRSRPPYPWGRSD